MSSNVKHYKVNWKANYNYDLLCFMHTLIICTVYEIQPVKSFVSFIWYLNAIRLYKVKGLYVNWKIKYNFI